MVLTVAAGIVMIPIDITIVNVALAQLSEQTGASLPVIQWVSTGYTLALATVIPAAAWAMNRFGVCRLFLAAITLFTLGSALVACSWNVEALIVFRVLKGLAGGVVLPAAMTLILGSAPPDRRGQMMALMGLPVVVAPVLGPVLGGWLLDSWSWRAMVLVNVPFGLVGVTLGVRNLPRLPLGPRQRLDLPGLLLRAPAMALLVLGTSSAQGRLLTASVLVPVAASVDLTAVFVSRALRVPAPLLDVRLLGRRVTGGGRPSCCCSPEAGPRLWSWRRCTGRWLAGRAPPPPGGCWSRPAWPRASRCRSPAG
ncbi:MAG: MFS transporter [Phycicoccus sp.]